MTIWDKMGPDMDDAEIEALVQIGNNLGPHGLSDYQLQLLCCRCIKVIYAMFAPLPIHRTWPKINWEGLYYRALLPEKRRRYGNPRHEAGTPPPPSDTPAASKRPTDPL
jgi:hypothetical protein